MRKFLVRQFCGYFTIRIGKEIEITALRCVRIGWPLFLFLMACVGLFSTGIRWAEYGIWFFGILFIIYIWMTFGWIGFGYFELWPPKMSELDKEQIKQINDYKNLNL